MGRPAANTKLGQKRVRVVRCRGGNEKFRALRLESGNFSWGAQNCTRKTRVLDVVYNASNNELVRTKTLVKSAIVLVDAAPFRAWYEQHYGAEIGRKKKTTEEPAKQSGHVKAKLAARKAEMQAGLDQHVLDQFTSGRLYACISSRPGQSGRCDGYILEGKELDFYQKKVTMKKKAK